MLCRFWDAKLVSELYLKAHLLSTDKQDVIQTLLGWCNADVVGHRLEGVIGALVLKNDIKVLLSARMLPVLQ